MIKLFLTDVDGCLTDGGMYYGDDGTEFKRFCAYDGMGMALLQQAGIPCGILTSENIAIVEKRARKLNLAYLYMGVGSKVARRQCLRYAPASDTPTLIHPITKLQAAQQICNELGITLHDVCFVGDDINDLDLLRQVGLPVCPPNARPEIRALQGIHMLSTPGGQGAVREICDYILAQADTSTRHTP